MNYDKFLISINFLSIVRSGISDVEIKEKLREEVIKGLKKETFQKWQSIRDGLKIVLPIDFNKQVAGLARSSDKPHGVFDGDKLKELNDIRDNLVHSFGRNYSENSIRNDICIDGEESIQLIKVIIDSIHNIFLSYESSHS